MLDVKVYEIETYDINDVFDFAERKGLKIIADATDSYKKWVSLKTRKKIMFTGPHDSITFREFVVTAFAKMGLSVGTPSKYRAILIEMVKPRVKKLKIDHEIIETENEEDLEPVQIYEIVLSETDELVAETSTKEQALSLIDELIDKYKTDLTIRKSCRYLYGNTTCAQIKHLRAETDAKGKYYLCALVPYYKKVTKL